MFFPFSIDKLKNVSQENSLSIHNILIGGSIIHEKEEFYNVETF